MSIPCHERKWIDVDPGKFSHGGFEVSKFMIRLLRHDESVPREEDGAVRFDDLAEKFKAKFDGTSQRSIEAWIAFLGKGGGPNKRFQYLLNPASQHLLYFRAIQGHSGGTLVEPALQDNVLLPHDFADYICHIGNAHDMHSIIQGGSIPGEKKSQEGQGVSVFHSREPDVHPSQTCTQYTHKHCTYSAEQSLHKRGTHRTRLAQELHSIFVRLKRSVIWSAHVSPIVALSVASYHEHIIFLIHSSFHHYTGTRSTIGTTRSTPRTPSTSSTSPRPPSRQAAPSRTTLA